MDKERELYLKLQQEEAQQSRAEIEAQGWLEEQYFMHQEKKYETVRQVAQKEAVRKHLQRFHQEAVKPKESYNSTFRKEVGLE